MLMKTLRAYAANAMSGDEGKNISMYQWGGVGPPLGVQRGPGKMKKEGRRRRRRKVGGCRENGAS